MASSTRSVLVRLPREILTMIFSHVDNPSQLRGVVLACKDLHAAVIGNQTAISFSMIRRHNDEEWMHMAMARYAAATAPWKQPLEPSLWTRALSSTYQEKIDRFCEDHLQSQTPLLQQNSTLAMAHSILSFQSAVAKISGFYGNAIANPILYAAGRDADPNMMANVNLPMFEQAPMTETERIRVEKALYIIELIRYLFPLHVGIQRQYQSRSNADWLFNRFWRCFAPWENRQVDLMVRWMQTSLKRALKGDHFKRVVYREDLLPHDRRVEAIIVLGIEKMVPIVMRGRGFKSRVVQESLDKQYSGFLYNHFRWHIEADERAWFNQDAIRGTNTGLIRDCNYLQYNEKDCGPRDAWLYSLTWVRPRGALRAPLRKFLFNDHYGVMFLCLSMFWDRERLDRTYLGLFPSHKDMIQPNANRRISLPVDVSKDVLGQKRGGEEGIVVVIG
ncbi:hypothetical protein F4810DRAFT_713337 [Camillea tinctor]|nr:hypothetical protein F4810DRAFT_713337 [Camillea tinctor]